MLKKPNLLPIFRRCACKKNVRKGCECLEVTRVDEIVEEKKCVPCSFANWKPKTKNQIQADLQDEQKDKEPRLCYPGMVLNKPTICKRPSEIDPFTNKLCLKRKSIKRPPIPAPLAEKPLPICDWDHNCKQ